jgi:HSP20 family molecular chaperone IbpA
MLTQQKETSNRGQMVDHLKKLASRGEEAPVVVPAVDIFESNTEVVLEVEMAGVTKDTIQTSVNGDTLEITGKAAVPDLPKEYTPLYSERRSLRYQRAFVLGAELQADKIRANYDNGLLRLTIPKVEKPKPKIIAIE